MPPPEVVQVTVRTASDSVVPCEVIGSSSFAFFTSTVQPGLGWALTNANGVSSGSVTRIFVVEAVSDSVGTRKTTLPNPPAAASGLETVTWAAAGLAVRTKAVRRSAAHSRAKCRDM